VVILIEVLATVTLTTVGAVKPLEHEIFQGIDRQASYFNFQNVEYYF
jgi:hypothetical protein